MKFTIRDLLWLTVVVTLGVGWWVNRQQFLSLAEERDRLWHESALKTLDGLQQSIGVRAHFKTPDGQYIGDPPVDPANIRDSVWKGEPLHRQRQVWVWLWPEDENADVKEYDVLESRGLHWRWSVRYVREYPRPNSK